MDLMKLQLKLPKIPDPEDPATEAIELREPASRKRRICSGIDYTVEKVKKCEFFVVNYEGESSYILSTKLRKRLTMLSKKWTLHEFLLIPREFDEFAPTTDIIVPKKEEKRSGSGVRGVTLRRFFLLEDFFLLPPLITHLSPFLISFLGHWWNF